MPQKGIVVGTAGHIDHGKTALVKALTGIDADRPGSDVRRIGRPDALGADLRHRVDADVGHGAPHLGLEDLQDPSDACLATPAIWGSRVYMRVAVNGGGRRQEMLY